MRKPIAPPLFLLVVSLLLHGVAWWVKMHAEWNGTDALLIISGLLLGWRVVAIGARMTANSRPLPMD